MRRNSGGIAGLLCTARLAWKRASSVRQTQAQTLACFRAPIRAARAVTVRRSRWPLLRAPFPCAALTSRPSWPQRSQRRRRITDTSLAPRRATAGGGLIKDAVEAELLFVADALQTGVGLLGREVGGRIGSSDYQAAALQAGASRTAYAPARCLIAKSFAFAGGSAVILSAVHPLAEAIASASPSASVKQFSNNLIMPPGCAAALHARAS